MLAILLAISLVILLAKRLIILLFISLIVLLAEMVYDHFFNFKINAVYYFSFDYYTTKHS